MQAKAIQVTLPSELVRMTAIAYPSKTISASIKTALNDAIIFDLKGIRNAIAPDYYYVNTTFSSRKERRTYSIRLDDAIVNLFRIYLGGGIHISNLIENALYKALTLSSKKESTLLDCTQETKTIYVYGNKYDDVMTSAIRMVTDGKKWDNSIEFCAGGLGIHANHRLARKERINDSDSEKINFYRCVKENPALLKSYCYILNPSTESKYQSLLAKQKDYGKLSDSRSNRCFKPDYERAAVFMIKNLILQRERSKPSFTGKRYTMREKYFENIGALSIRLKNTKISNMGLFDIWNGHYVSENTLIILDPPYLLADIYNNKENEFTYKDHIALRDKLLQHKGDFIYFCRITASRLKSLTEKQLHVGDFAMCSRIDDLYCGHGLYYLDVKLNNGSVDRIIANFSFDNARLYDKPNTTNYYKK